MAKMYETFDNIRTKLRKAFIHFKTNGFQKSSGKMFLCVLTRRFHRIMYFMLIHWRRMLSCTCWKKLVEVFLNTKKNIYVFFNCCFRKRSSVSTVNKNHKIFSQILQNNVTIFSKKCRNFEKKIGNQPLLLFGSNYIQKDIIVQLGGLVQNLFSRPGG